MKPQRPRPSRRTKGVVLIQCEGSDTEYNYFLGLRGDCGRDAPLRLVPKRGEGGDAVEVVRRAVKEVANARARGEAYDEAWCVLDVEREGQAARLTEAVVLAERNGIRLCLSNPCFEVWLVAHFEAVARPFAGCGAAERYLAQRHWRPLVGSDYDKADPDVYRRLADRLTAAVANARTVLEQHHNGDECQKCNSSTQVYQLIHRLLTPGGLKNRDSRGSG